jgi:hypothetical protein
MTKARDLANAGTALTTVSATELGYLDGVTSAVQTQLNRKPEFTAGKNKVINGDFGVWQRGTSFTPAAGGATVYTTDRFFTQRDGTGATVTVSRQTFTPGTAPVAGYESEFFYRYAQSVAGTGGTYNNLCNTKLEDVRIFANQTVTFSFWAKADATRSLTITPEQNFGSGGSSSVYPTGATVTLTTSWARYSVTINVPSISGKTIGTSSFFTIFLSGSSNITQTIDIWGVQLEAGSVATPFQTATGSVQGELAACQRYYWRATSTDGYARFSPSYPAKSTTVSEVSFVNPVVMRTIPTSFDYSTITLNDGSANISIGTPTVTNSSTTLTGVLFTTTGLTQYRPYQIIGNNSTAAYVGFSAEL